jgi:hypothetical protein
LLLDVWIEQAGSLQTLGMLVAAIVRVIERAQPEQSAWPVVPANTAAPAEVVGERVWPARSNEWLGPRGALILLFEELDDRPTGRRERPGVLTPAATGQPTFEHAGKIRGRAVVARAPAC